VIVTKQRVLVIGLGAFGTAIVESLWRSRLDVVAVDPSEAAVDRVKGRTATAFVGDGSDAKVLADIGASDMDAAVVSFGEDFEACVLAVASLKKLGVPQIVARSASERQSEVLRAVGATRVLELEREMGARIATELFTECSTDLLDFAHGYRVVPWIATGQLVGKSLIEAGLRKTYDVTVLGVGHGRDLIGGTHRIVPTTPDYRIQKGDTLMLVGEEVAVARFLAEH
jgi:trk system potassium uptake protein TrkA